MKILVVANMYPTKQNPSSGVFIKKVTDKLSNSAEFDVSIWKLRQGNKYLSYMHFYLFFIIKLFFVRPDIVYCHFISHTGVLGWLAKKLLGSKLVLNAHGSDIMNSIKKESRLFKLNQYLLSHADLVVVPSVFLKNTIQTHFSIEPTKLFISPSGGVVLSPNEKNKNQSTTLKLGFVGRLIPMKGIDIIVDALLGCQNIELYVAGSGDFTFVSKKLNKCVKVNYFGEVPQNELNHLYDNIDLLLFPTKFEESLGLTPLEAMAHSVPVIGSDSGAVSEYIKHGVNGYLIPVGDPVKLRESIEQFRMLPMEEQKKMRQFSYDTAKQFDETLVSVKLRESLLSIF
jgi:glycosyltransferase involved in cell wall biosynthesis